MEADCFCPMGFAGPLAGVGLGEAVMGESVDFQA